MADRLKDQFLTRDSILRFASAIKDVYPAFDADRFVALVFDQTWSGLELKNRMHHITRSLGATLPQHYGDALEILKRSIPSVHGFEVMVCPDFVELYGQEDPDRSLPALGYFTQFGSSEFAIRPFLDRDPERTIPYLLRWADDPDPRVRRLASEGSRPRLPWAMGLPAFKRDPSPILPLLEKLKNDESETVRRSVANNLNDIAKDHPQTVIALCKRWIGVSPNTDKLLKHACRGLLRSGNSQAMRLFGFFPAAKAAIKNLRLSPASIRIGGALVMSFVLQIGGKSTQTVRLEYGITFARPGGRESRKVFQLSEKRFTPGSHTITKRHAFADLSTRKHHPGRHTVEIIINGNRAALARFVVTGPITRK